MLKTLDSLRYDVRYAFRHFHEHNLSNIVYQTDALAVDPDFKISLEDVKKLGRFSREIYSLMNKTIKLVKTFHEATNTNIIAKSGQAILDNTRKMIQYLTYLLNFLEQRKDKLSTERVKEKYNDLVGLIRYEREMLRAFYEFVESVIQEHISRYKRIS